MDSRAKTIIRTLLLCLAASVSIALLKIYYGVQSHSLAFISDGIHSSFDSIATILGIISIFVSTKPPDSEYPYGHRKFETLSAMALAVLLILAAREMGELSYQRIVIGTGMPEFTRGGVILLVVAMATNFFVARYENRMAKTLSSYFLASDSVHNESDFVITVGILITIISTKLGIPYVDPIASLLIAIYLVILATRLVLHNMKPLADHRVVDPKNVEDIVRSVDGVVFCHQIRSRGEHWFYFLDLNLHLPGQITLERAHEISHQVESKLKAALPGLVDVIIHTEPHNHPPCQPSKLYSSK